MRNGYREWKGNLGIFIVLTRKNDQFFRIPGAHSGKKQCAFRISLMCKFLKKKKLSKVKPCNTVTIFIVFTVTIFIVTTRKKDQYLVRTGKLELTSKKETGARQ